MTQRTCFHCGTDLTSLPEDALCPKCIPTPKPTTCPACMTESAEMVPPDESGGSDWLCRMCWESDVRPVSDAPSHTPEEVNRAIETILRLPPSPPSDRIGKLVAHDTGDGWALSVMAGGEQIAIVEWPAQWTTPKNTSELREAGFEVRP